MVGSARLAERRLTTLFQEFGAARLLAAVEAMLDATERRTRAVVAAWRDGVYEGHATLDDDGHGREDIVIRARVTKSGSDLTVDLTASDPQSTSFVNSSHANMQSAVAMAFAYLIDADIPKNDGAFRVLKVIAKPGTVVWANEGAPVTLCTSHCSNEIVEAIVTALADACPDRAMAGWGRRFRIAIAGTDPRTRRKFIWHLFHARPGGGASPAGDGWPSGGEWHSVGGIKFGSVEVAEARFPLHFIRHELRPDSGGAGQYRGGPARSSSSPSRRRKSRSRIPPATACATARAVSPAATTASLTLTCFIRTRAAIVRCAPRRSACKLSPGDVLVVHSSGGGGWGDPARRSAAQHAADRLVGPGDRRDGPRMSFIIGIDVGGTFTDLVAVDARGQTTSAKASTTPADPGARPVRGAGRAGAPARRDATRAAARRAARHSRHHGRDQCTARTQGRQGRPAHHRRTPRHPRDARGPEGGSLQPADAAAGAAGPASSAARRARAHGCAGRRSRAARSCLARGRDRPARGRSRRGGGDLFPARLPQSGATSRLRPTRSAPRCPASSCRASHEVYPQIKEYERTSTTIINAYVGPKLSTYLQSLEARLKTEGLAGPLYIMLSHGGVASVAEAVRLAGATLLSGPAGGVAAAHRAAQIFATGNVIPFDMGGTSTDISIVRNGERPVSSERAIAGHKVALPSLDIVTLGAGGGSIARVDAAGILRVGPESAGARARSRVLRPRRHGGDGHRCERRARAPRSRQLSRRPHAARSRRRGSRHRPPGARARRRPHGGGGRSLSPGQFAHGGGHSPRHGAARRRSVGASRCCRSAAPPARMSSRSRGSSA